MTPDGRTPDDAEPADAGGEAGDVHDPVARAEEALRVSDARLHAVIANLPGSAVFVVDRGLRYRFAEGEALARAGYTPRDLVGKTVAEAMPPELVAEYEARYRGVLDGQRFDVEHTSHGRDYISRGTPLRDRSGAIDSALVVSHDITERKRKGLHGPIST